MKKRNLFDELNAGFDELADARAGKTTLRTSTVEVADPVEVTPEELRAVRERLHVSQAVMAARLRMKSRTYQNWEQGRAKPSTHAAILIKLMEKHPETLEHLASL
ncbi:XRE family transcriptional regulator [Caballeronia choica]|jgi:putative transcriptional regulator|uniref:XRE family transcriptional regulator n=1 Tax=Caballeronia choica TaxID=326476 RepID=A0A158KE46_9BURK|nr:helix-turn-helix domain-containing protein [Caballeronia choica]SAL79059.1 XRE family transcriptional regulator [Caballeronia choica]